MLKMNSEAEATAPSTFDQILRYPRRIRDQAFRRIWRPIRLLYLRNNRLRRIAAWVRLHRRRVAAAVLLFAHLLGIIASLNVLTESRTPQGSIAWIVSLNTFPYVAVPLYWAIGETDYGKQVTAYRARMSDGAHIHRRLRRNLEEQDLVVASREDIQQSLSRLANLPVTRGNRVDVLVDGIKTFDAIFESIENATDYVLVEFYILRGDHVGSELKELLIRKSRQGVQVRLLYDEYGSRDLSSSYVDDLRDAGVEVNGFNSPLADGSTTRLNFRNHRKLVVVDGRVAFVGGHNVGDEYVRGVDDLGPYRDTHVRVEGPLVQTCQIAFAEDWHAVTDQLLEDLNWQPRADDENDIVGLCLPTGPADQFETASMFFLEAIHSAKERVWIATPYFVPDEQMVTALQLASLRGVDVRIVIPKKSDSTLVWLSSYSYLPEMEMAGVRVYRYQGRFMHQKVVLVDNNMASIGTANFDNRSFRLNFEIMMVLFDEGIATEVANMLEDDIRQSELAPAKEMTESSYPFQLLVRGSRLLAPIQ